MPPLKSSVSFWLLSAVATSLGGSLACGGPGTIDPPPPTQNVEAYFAGTEANGDLHIHVHFKQNGRTLTQIDPCVPQDDCDIYPLTPKGQTEVGSQFVVNLASGSGTFTDPGITFTITTTTGKTFTFTGTVIQSQQMKGTISGPTHPASALQLDKQ